MSDQKKSAMTDWCLIDLRQIIDAMRVTEDQRKAYYEKYQIDLKGPIRRVTREEKDWLQKICDATWKAQNN